MISVVAAAEKRRIGCFFAGTSGTTGTRLKLLGFLALGRGTGLGTTGTKTAQRSQRSRSQIGAGTEKAQSFERGPSCPSGPSEKTINAKNLRTVGAPHD